jgi:L-ascorbate metabolism protein UlaG (beta-lactamase superfamily)
MKFSRRSFLKSSAGAGIGLAMSLGSERGNAIEPKNATRIQLIRHATSIIHYGGRVLLVDPMLSDQGAMPALNHSPNPRPNPLVPLPIAAEKVLAGIEVILVTHTHRDHWDAAATKLVPKDANLFIQPPDAAKFAELGFSSAQKIDDSVSWKGIKISRTGGQHGRGEIGRQMAPVSGYVLSTPGAPTLYIAGDTVWCPEVADAIQTHKPDIIIVNSGAPQFLEGGPICMDTDDVLNVCQAAPKAKVIAVHMEAINHCILTRSGLRDALKKSTLKPPVLIPQDGEELRFA